MSSDSGLLLEVKDLKKSYLRPENKNESFNAVDGISFNILAK